MNSNNTQEISLFSHSIKPNKTQEIKIKSSFLLVNKFINLLMKDGKKAKATTILLKSFNILKKKMLFRQSSFIDLNKSNKNQQNIEGSPKNLSSNKVNAPLKTASKRTINSFDVLRIFSQAIENVAPSVEVRKVRKAGTTFLVPSAVTPTRGTFKAMCWIIEAAQNKRGSSFSNRHFTSCLADEIMLASQKQGKAREKRNELHKLAIANRAYTRYRWW